MFDDETVGALLLVESKRRIGDRLAKFLDFAHETIGCEICFRGLNRHFHGSLRLQLGSCSTTRCFRCSGRTGIPDMAYARVVPDRPLRRRERLGGAESAAKARHKAWGHVRVVTAPTKAGSKWRAMSPQ